MQVVYEENTPSGRASTRLGVEIKVLDINDNPPVFSKEIYYATLEESKQQGKTNWFLVGMCVSVPC